MSFAFALHLALGAQVQAPFSVTDDHSRVGPHQLSPCGHAMCGACGVTWLESRVRG